MNSEYPQFRDVMATCTRELWMDEKTLTFSMAAEADVPRHWHVEWRCLWKMPFGAYEKPFTLTAQNFAEIRQHCELPSIAEKQ